MGDLKAIDFGGGTEKSPHQNVSGEAVKDTESQVIIQQNPTKISFSGDSEKSETVKERIKSTERGSGEFNRAPERGSGEFNRAPEKIDFNSQKKEDNQITSELREKSRMLQHMLQYMDKNSITEAPNINDIILNSDSSLDASKTLETKYDETDSVTAGLNKKYEELLNLANVQAGLEAYANQEASNPERKQVFINFMIGDIVVGNYEGFDGDRINLPSLDDIKKAMGNEWDSAQFAGWDSDGIAHNTDVHAILKKQCSVKIYMNGRQIDDVDAIEGTDVLKIVDVNAKKFGLLTPIKQHYSIKCASRTIKSDSVIKFETKTAEAQEAAEAKFAESHKCTVIFAIRPSDLGLNTSKMSEDAVKDATIIQKVVVGYGDSVQPPSDEVISAHGLMTPFSKYYTWSGNLDHITSNTVIKAEPLTIMDRAESLKDVSMDDVVSTGKDLAKRAINAIKYPAILYTAYKLVKEFEKGKRLQTKDFVFLRKRNELMLYKYTGVNSVIEIPAVVNGMYVKYIHPCAFTSGPFKFSTLFNKNKLFSTDRYSSAAGSTEQLILPRTIKYIPENFLYHVTGVTTIVIPESVSEMSPNAFNGSSVEEIYFNGMCPNGFNRDSIDAEVFVRRKAYKSFFKGAMK